SSLTWRGGDHLHLCLSHFRLPKPVLSVLPGHEVVAGSYVTFRCTIAHSSAGCFLYLEGQVKTLSLLSNKQDDFNLSHVHKGNGGRYSCQCFTKGASFEWSAVSKTLDLVVRGETSPHSMFLSSTSLVPLGGATGQRLWVEGVPQGRDVGGRANRSPWGSLCSL
uniref:Immunoglobulin-like beta-sandwich domain-containing protein n=1 Tax=Accipiter nisus TaxID=211598 RepID=A0A8B9MLU5_9AVES